MPPCSQRMMSGKIRCAHLLCKHAKSRNPESRRTGESTKEIPVEDAHKELQKFIDEFKGLEGQKLVDAFCAAAQKRSDCGSYKSGGDLGNFTRGMMQKAFEDAAFALEVGQMSGIVDSDSGSHLILRIA
mmetsp:Transcript_16791/g.20165  ORF Transcript_16791/g.20165 Transcript_16791/m.20165 type:complete len:129 (+) Transcript_16791:21-407(+)